MTASNCRLSVNATEHGCTPRTLDIPGSNLVGNTGYTE